MPRRQHFLEADDRAREQNLRFVRGPDDDMEQFFAGSGRHVEAPPREYKIVTPRPDEDTERIMDDRKDFFRQIGLPRHESYEWAQRSLKMPGFDPELYRDKRHRLRRQGHDQETVDKEIFEEIKLNYRKIVQESRGVVERGHRSERSRSADRIRISRSIHSTHSKKGRSPSRHQSRSVSMDRTPPPPPMLSGNWQQNLDLVDLTHVEDQFMEQAYRRSISPRRRRSRSPPKRRNESPSGGIRRRRLSRYVDTRDNGNIDLEELRQEKGRLKTSPRRRRPRSRSRSPSPKRRNASPGKEVRRRRPSRFEEISKNSNTRVEELLRELEKTSYDEHRRDTSPKRPRSRSPIRRNVNPDEERRRPPPSRFPNTLDKNNLNKEQHVSPTRSPKWETMLADIDEDNQQRLNEADDLRNKLSRTNLDKRGEIQRQQREANQSKPNQYKEFKEHIERRVQEDKQTRQDTLEEEHSNHLLSRVSRRGGQEQNSEIEKTTRRINIDQMEPKPQRAPRTNNGQPQTNLGQSGNAYGNSKTSFPERNENQTKAKLDSGQKIPRIVSSRPEPPEQKNNETYNSFDQPDNITSQQGKTWVVVEPTSQKKGKNWVIIPDGEIEKDKAIIAMSGSKFLTHDQQKEHENLYRNIIKGKEPAYKQSIKQVRSETLWRNARGPPLPNLRKATFWENWWKINGWIENDLLKVSDNDSDLLVEININRSGPISYRKNIARKLLVSCEKVIVDSLNKTSGMNVENAYGFLKAKVMLFELFVDSTVPLSSTSKGIRAHITRLLDKPNMMVYYLSLIDQWKKTYECMKDTTAENRLEAIQFLADKVFNWLVGLAFNEIKLYSGPIVNRVPKELTLKDIFNEVCRISNHSPEVRRVFFFNEKLATTPNNIVREKMEICNFLLENKPRLKFPKLHRFMVARILLTDPAWNAKLDPDVRREKDAFLEKLAHTPYIEVIYEHLLNKMIRAKIRIDYLKAIHPRLKCLKDRKNISMLASFVERIDVQYMCKCILVERLKKHGTFVDPLHNDFEYFEKPNSDDEEELQEKTGDTEELVQCSEYSHIHDVEDVFEDNNQGRYNPMF